MTQHEPLRVLLEMVLFAAAIVVLGMATVEAAQPTATTNELPLTLSHEGRFKGEPILVEITIDRYVENSTDTAEEVEQASDRPEQYLWDIVITTLQIKHRTVDRGGISMLEIKRSKRGEIVFWGRNTTLSPTERPSEYVSIGEIGFLVETESASDDEVQFQFSHDRSGGHSLTVFYYKKPIDPREALKLKE